MDSARRAAAAEEFANRGGITSAEYLYDTDYINPTTLPDSPFNFIGMLEDPEAVFPGRNGRGQEVAVIGAGNAGTAAASLLMRLGFQPVVYDITGRVGGRSYTYRFPSAPEAQAELGSMRIPTAQKLVFFLLHRWGIGYKQMPNPLVADTVIDVNGQQVFWDRKTGTYTQGPPQLIAQIENVKTKYTALVAPFTAAWNAAAGNLDAQIALWQSFVAGYNNKSLYQVLLEYGWSNDEITLFGNIGIGSGGFDSFFGSSFLEIIRIEVQQLEKHGTQQLIIGGTNQIPLGFWTEKVECLHWGVTSVEERNGGKPRPGVASIRTPPRGSGGPIRITDTAGDSRDYPAVILTACPRAIDTTIDINLEAFSIPVWTALRNVEVTSSEKVFILTKTPFWKEPGTKFKLYTTLTDQPPRQMYTWDSSDWGTNSPHGAVILSYSWADSSIRFNALNDQQRVELCLNTIANIAFYGPEMRDKLKSEMIDSVSLCWEDQYGYSGGYRMANPGQAQEVLAMYKQSLGQPKEWDNGLYLAGEALSWYGLSGWVDGAIKTGMQAAMTTILRLG
jgi:monoamine oxidase